MELNINKDISKYRMTFKGYTPRAIVCTALILSICVAIALGLYDYLLMEAQLVLIIVTCFPIALFYLDDVPSYSLPTEKIRKIILLSHFCRNANSTYRDPFRTLYRWKHFMKTVWPLSETAIQ